MVTATNKRTRLWAMSAGLLLFCAGAFLLFFSDLGRTFVSDDFLVLKRVGMDKVIWIKGFFRPLSDITLYGNYLIGGFDPAGYYAVNILMHGINSWLLFRFCLDWQWTKDREKQRLFALLAALLFLAYPFHSEGISWILGRAAISAALFGMAAMLAVVSDLSREKRIFWCCLFYFVGMAGYESVMLLPLMVVVVVFGQSRSVKELAWWALALGGTLGIHILLRILVSGGVAGEYGSGFFTVRWLHYGKNLLALWGRLFLPPMQDIRVMGGCWLLLTAGVAVLSVAVWRRMAGVAGARNRLLQWLVLLAIACVIPILSGVSTHTSEGDRFLYFPAYFFCAGIAFILVQSIGDKRWLAVVMLLLLGYEVYFLEAGNRNWMKASETVREVLNGVSGPLKSGGAGDTADTAAVRGKTFVVNLPDEVDGAYIFRLGLPEALLIHGLDTSGLVIVNHLERDEELRLPDSLRIRVAGDVTRLMPDVAIWKAGADSFRIDAIDRAGRHTWYGGKGDIVLYWCRRRFLEWKPTK